MTFGAGPVVDGMGLINIIGSYDQQFVLSFTACREMMPDPARYADALQQAFEDSSRATTPRSRPARRPRRDTTGKTPASLARHRLLSTDVESA